MISFKKKCKEISQLCHEMASIKETIHEFSATVEEPKYESRVKIRYIMFIQVVVLSLVIFTLYVFSMCLTLDKLLLNISSTQLSIAKLNIAISSLCWIYPPISMSADILICNILKEMGDIILTWNKYLTIDYSIHTIIQFSSNDHTLLEDNSRKHRYVL